MTKKMKPLLSIAVNGVNRCSINTENGVPSDQVSIRSCVEHLAGGRAPHVDYMVRRLLVRNCFPAEPEIMMRAWVHFPRCKLWVEMAVRRRENNCEEDKRGLSFRFYGSAVHRALHCFDFPSNHKLPCVLTFSGFLRTSLWRSNCFQKTEKVVCPTNHFSILRLNRLDTI